MILRELCVFAFGIPFRVNHLPPHALWAKLGVKVSPRFSSGKGVPTVGGVSMSWWEGEISENYVCHYVEMIITLTVFCQAREIFGLGCVLYISLWVVFVYLRVCWKYNLVEVWRWQTLLTLQGSNSSCEPYLHHLSAPSINTHTHLLMVAKKCSKKQQTS